MGAQLVTLHWVYALFMLIILALLVARREIILPSALGLFFIGLSATGSLSGGISALFNGLTYAGSEFIGIILVISTIVAMSKLLQEIGANDLMVAPVASLIRTPDLAYWFVGIVMFVVSLFFWPSPSTALVGAVLLPVALRVGLPAIGVAMAMNLFGHGTALSGDFIIQGAPTITSKAAGLEVSSVISASFPLVLIMGLVSTVVGYIMLKRDLNAGKFKAEVAAYQTAAAANDVANDVAASKKMATPVARWAAVVVPIAFLLDLVVMATAKLRGGDATALVGGTAFMILVVFTIIVYGMDSLDKIREFLKQGLVFGIEIFGPIIPIAAFFFVGELGPLQAIVGKEAVAAALPKSSQGLLSDMGLALAAAVPMNRVLVAFMETIVGGITGLDGSGFSGLGLAGSLAKVFGAAVNGSVATLTALGQIAGIWVGGGTLIPWAVIPAAAIAGVSPADLVRRNFLPVMTGLVVTTIIAIFII